MLNHFATCLFSQVEVYLNGVQVADLSSAVTYPWRMFIQSFLSYNSEVKKTYLAAEGYYPESANEVDTINLIIIIIIFITIIIIINQPFCLANWDDKQLAKQKQASFFRQLGLGAFC